MVTVAEGRVGDTRLQVGKPPAVAGRAVDGRRLLLQGERLVEGGRRHRHDLERVDAGLVISDLARQMLRVARVAVGLLGPVYAEHHSGDRAEAFGAARGVAERASKLQTLPSGRLGSLVP